MSDASKVTWVATLSDGTTAVEHTGEFIKRPGEKTPWVKLVRHLGENGLSLTSLRLNFNGRTIHMPRATFDRFSYNAKNRAPLSYSLQYPFEAEMDPGSGQLLTETKFVELVAHYPSFNVHFIQDVTNGNNSWVVVTEGVQTMAPTPFVMQQE